MDKETLIRDMQNGFDLLVGQSKIIAMLPLEDWLRAFERAETVAPIVDPTLYRDYLYDPECKGKKIKSLIVAAIPLKQAILKIQSEYTRA